MQRFRGGLVVKARRLLYQSTGLRVIKKKQRIASGRAPGGGWRRDVGGRVANTRVFRSDCRLISHTATKRLSAHFGPKIRYLMRRNPPKQYWNPPRQYCLPRGLWTALFWVIQEIPLKAGVWVPAVGWHSFSSERARDLQQRVVRERTPGPSCPPPPAGGLSTWSCWSCNQ